MDKEKIKEDVNRTVDKFAEAMKEVLLNPKNIKKETSWKTCDILFLKNKLNEEYNEFTRERNRFCEDFFHIPKRNRKSELIDIANVCMMLWDRLNGCD